MSWERFFLNKEKHFIFYYIFFEKPLEIVKKFVLGQSGH